MPPLFRALALLIVLTVGHRAFADANDSSALIRRGAWQIEFDPATGALVRVENTADTHPFNWIREAGHWDKRTWITDDKPGAIRRGGQWGIVETSHTGQLHAAEVKQLGETAWETVYVAPTLTVTVRRELDVTGGLSERYTFKNTGQIALEFPMGSIAITAPLFDQYPDAERSIGARCHVHLWMGGSSAWINAVQMSGQPPGLGLVVTEGSLDGYSQRGGTISERGTFLLHPAAMKLGSGQSQTVAWRLFWHTGWDDFFAKLKAQESFVQLTARRLVVEAGEPLEITAKAAHSIEGATVRMNGKTVETLRADHALHATLPTSVPGEMKIELQDGDRRTWLNANVVPRIEALIDARVRFIVQHQQRHAPGDPLDGAYLAYDNETEEQIYSTKNDFNAARERVGMGVLGALYLQQCHDAAFKAELAASLARYAAFVAREIEDDDGTVYNNIGRRGTNRHYNWPWVAHFHLAMFRATGDVSQLDRMVRVVRSFYAHGGKSFYVIGLPVTDALTTLAGAGRTAQRDELLASFRAHADQILANGIHYPMHEVNYEQSIVAPAVQLLLEVYLATHDTRYLDGARAQLPLLEAFCGRQPDHRLNGIAIRHWDDFWFGKLRLYGDTFPHYWSTLNALTEAYLARATADASHFDRARDVLFGNLSLFTPDGRGSAAHIFPLSSDGRPAARNDPVANDQDWALVHLLMVRELMR